MVELVAKNLSISHDNVEVVHSASFTVASGELVALLGSNGAGKSTLIRTCVGLQAAHSGTAFINGDNAHKLLSLIHI